MPLENGVTAIGNTIVRYSKIRKMDIDSNGKDQECHLNDEELQDVTLNLDDLNLRRIYRSIGIVNKEGNFPVATIMDISNNIDKIYANKPEENVAAQLLELSKLYPDFAECQNSTMCMLKDVFLNHENIGYDECVVNRVYNRDDEKKRPTFYAYIDYGNEAGKKFYVANKEEGKFDEYGLEEFEKQFECYEWDLKKSNGIRPWEAKQIENQTDLSRSSGNLVATENSSAEVKNDNSQKKEEGEVEL